VAAGGRPLPDYRAAVLATAAAHAAALNAAGRYPDAVDYGRRFVGRVTPTAGVAYEVAYAWNRMGDLSAALAWYGRALELDPEHAASRYDRGEILLALGRDEEAAPDLEAAARLRPDHWAVHFRLAMLAGRAGDRDRFEVHLTDALRQGFDFRAVASDAEWRAFARDDKLGDVIAKLIVVYGDERVLEGLLRER
jgi:tetratricopeptide (TPR) repeat protein